MLFVLELIGDILLFKFYDIVYVFVVEVVVVDFYVECEELCIL